MEPGGKADVAIDKAFSVLMYVVSWVVGPVLILVDDYIKPFFKKKGAK
jgi:hypothetical protein